MKDYNTELRDLEQLQFSELDPLREYLLTKIANSVSLLMSSERSELDLITERIRVTLELYSYITGLDDKISALKEAMRSE